MAMGRGASSRDVLLRVALVGALSVFYWAPQRFLRGAGDDDHAKAVETRLALSLLVTVAALVGIISTPLVVLSCVHAALHVAQSLLGIALCGTPWCSPSEHGVAACAYEYGSVLTFVAMVRYVLLPPPSILSTTRRHSRQLKRFFQQHDRKYVALVDRLLDDYTGNERLLFARIRKIYRTKTLSPP